MAAPFSRRFIQLVFLCLLAFAFSHKVVSGGFVKRILSDTETNAIATDEEDSIGIPETIDVPGDGDSEESLADENEENDEIEAESNARIVGRGLTSSMPLFPVDRDLLMLPLESPDEEGVDDDNSDRPSRKQRSADSAEPIESRPSSERNSTRTFYVNEGEQSDDSQQNARNKRSNAIPVPFLIADDIDTTADDVDDNDDDISRPIPLLSNNPVPPTKVPKTWTFLTTLKAAAKNLSKKLSLAGFTKLVSKQSSLEQDIKQRFTENAKERVNSDETREDIETNDDKNDDDTDHDDDSDGDDDDDDDSDVDEIKNTAIEAEILKGNLDGDMDDEDEETVDQRSLLALEVGMNSDPVYSTDTTGNADNEDDSEMDVEDNRSDKSSRKQRSVDKAVSVESRQPFYIGGEFHSDTPQQETRHRRDKDFQGPYATDEYDEFYDDDDAGIQDPATLSPIKPVTSTKAPQNGSIFSMLKSTVRKIGENLSLKKIGEKLSLTGPQAALPAHIPKQKFTENAKDNVPWEEPIVLNNCWAQAMLSPRYAFSPSCKADGTFTAKQCYLERCWCVSPDGTPTIDKLSNRFFYSLTGLLLRCKKNNSLHSG